MCLLRSLGAAGPHALEEVTEKHQPCVGHIAEIEVVIQYIAGLRGPTTAAHATTYCVRRVSLNQLKRSASYRFNHAVARYSEGYECFIGLVHTSMAIVMN